METPLTNSAYLGKHDNLGSIKSIYINDIEDINKQSLEGGGFPSSNRVGSRSTKISEPQEFVNDLIIPEISQKFKSMPLVKIANSEDLPVKTDDTTTKKQRLTKEEYAAIREENANSLKTSEQIANKALEYSARRML